MTTIAPTPKPKVYTKQFWLLCISSGLFFNSFSMILPELPGYLQRMGGGDYKGLIIGLFATMAAISRPFSGKLADSVGRVPIIMFGAVVCIVCSLLYPLVGLSVGGFLLLRMVHGMATGFTPTGTSSYVADIAPADRRGEALGLQTLVANIGSAYGQSLGSSLTNEYSIEVMFYVSSASALLSVLILLGLKETLPKPQPFSFKLMKLDRHEIFEPRVLFICVIMMLALFCFGLNLTLIPDFSEHLGMDNKGHFFSLLTLSSIITRLLGGKASDKWGRPVVTLLATIGLVVAMLYISFVETEDELLLAGFIFGIAHGMVGPTLFAWGIDKAKEGHLGRALATIYIALELGVLLGAVVGGAIYDNNIANFQMAYWVAAGLNMIGVAMSVGYNIKKRL